MYPLLRHFLFALDPEFAHALTLRGLRWTYCSGITRYLQKDFFHLPRKVMGLEFPNPIGVAAGLDKNADCIDGLAALGFGFIEVGTVTPRPQLGNPKPRLFRLPEAEALINRLGFNNRGLDYLIERIQQRQFKGILGVNIGKNADTPLEEAVRDYLLCLQQVYPFADYVTVNLSSPNTPGLRELQYGEQRETLFATLKSEQARLATQYRRYVPLVVKIAPDLSSEQLEDIAAALLRHGIDGVIATNTTSDHTLVQGLPYADQAGGLSGKPLFTQATHVVKQLHALLQDKIPIIAVGGIMRGDDARAKIAAGASLVQVYTGLIYRGPALIKEIALALDSIIQRPKIYA